MMKKETSTKSAKIARLLLTGYWGYKLFNGGDILKTTLDVLQISHRLNEREKLRGTQGAAKPVKSRRASIAGSIFLRKIISKLLKAARVY